VQEPDRAPSLLGILERYDWHQEAACYGEPDPRTFFPEEHDRTLPSSGSLLLPLLICSTCPVRRKCLEEAFASWDYHHGDRDRHTPRGVEERTRRGLPETTAVACGGNVEAIGIWGGTTESERRAVRDLPKDEAIDLLYRTCEQRLRVRIKAFEARPGRAATRRVKRIKALLEEMGRGRAKRA
jgi:hypothetical protein